MTVTQATTGFHGKLPCAGDFVHRRLPPAFVEPWDLRMQQLQWQARDLPPSASAWLFVIAPGVCGSNGWAGALMASHDRVGRRFPLTIAAALPAQAPAPGWLAAAATLLEAAPGFADVARFDHACQALATTPGHIDDAPPLHAGSAWRRAADAGGRWQVIDGLPDATHAALLLGQVNVMTEPAR